MGRSGLRVNVRRALLVAAYSTPWRPAETTPAPVAAGENSTSAVSRLRDTPKKGDKATFYSFDLGEERWKLTEAIYAGETEIEVGGRAIVADEPLALGGYGSSISIIYRPSPSTPPQRQAAHSPEQLPAARCPASASPAP